MKIRLGEVRLAESAPVSVTESRFAFVRLAWPKSAPDSVASERLAPVRLAWLRLAPVSVADSRNAFERFWPAKFHLLRSLELRMIPDKS